MSPPWQNKKGAPVETGTPYAHEFVAFRLLAIELADSNALAVLVDVTKVADADGLSNRWRRWP